MDAQTIIRKRRTFCHISDANIGFIVATMKNISLMKSDKMEAVRKLMADVGCSASTLYRIYKESVVFLKKHEDIRKEETVRTEFAAEAVVNQRHKGKKKSRENALKTIKSKVFVLRCIDYLHKNRLCSVDEAVNHIKTAYRNDETVCVKTLYSYIVNGLISTYKPKDLPRWSSWKRKPKSFKVYTELKSRGDSITERPEIIDKREEFGHWEGDLVTGPRDGENGAYLTLIERKTRYFLMIPVRNKKAETIYQALYDLKGRNDGFFNDLFKSITFDNGSEFSKWMDMEVNLGFKTYFARPYHSGDRGSNENCNGLIRRYIKKGTDINTI